MTKRISIALALALAAAPRPAQACSPVPPRWPRVAEPLFEDARIDIESERLDLDCKPHGRDAACTLVIAIRIRNVAPSPVQTTGAILTEGHAPTVVDPSAGAAPLALTISTPNRFFSALPAHRNVWTFLRRAFAFDVKLAAGEARDIVVKSSFVVQRFVDPCVDEGIQARHSIFAAGRRHGDFQLTYFHSNAGRALRRKHIDVHVRRPIAWRGEIDTLRSWSGDMKEPPGVIVNHQLDEERASVSVEHAEGVHVGLADPRSVVWGGGPFVGAGYAFAPASERGLRLRVGYELAAPAWLLHSVGFETDARRMFSIVPASEMITTSLSMMPIVLGAGAGVPVRIKPDVRAGARVQASMSLGPFTIRGALDVYPTAGERPSFVEGLIGGQVSL